VLVLLELSLRQEHLCVELALLELTVHLGLRRVLVAQWTTSAQLTPVPNVPLVQMVRSALKAPASAHNALRDLFPNQAKLSVSVAPRDTLPSLEKLLAANVPMASMLGRWVSQNALSAPKAIFMEAAMALRPLALGVQPGTQRQILVCRSALSALEEPMLVMKLHLSVLIALRDPSMVTLVQPQSAAVVPAGTLQHKPGSPLVPSAPVAHTRIVLARLNVVLVRKAMHKVMILDRHRSAKFVRPGKFRQMMVRRLVRLVLVAHTPIPRGCPIVQTVRSERFMVI
jgi:hypothetical protein